MASSAASDEGMSGNGASGSGSKPEPIDVMLQRLGFEEEEFDDLVLEEEDVPMEGMKWLALARVHTSNMFSVQTFEQHMRNAWSPAREVKFSALEENLFTIQCSCLGDWLKVTEAGPWLFRQNAVIIEPYDGISPIDSVELNFLAVWVQIHNLPPGYRRENLITNLAERKLGQVLKVETDLAGIGNFVRVWARVDVRKVVTRAVTISRNGNRDFYMVKYEKFPRFCGACGHLGHSYTECGTGEHDVTKLKWGDWLKADWETWQGRRVPFVPRASDNGGRRGGGDFGGRRGGRGNFFDWRQHPERHDNQDPECDELRDTASSPVKNADVIMSEKEKSARKRLALENVVEAPHKSTGKEVVVFDKAETEVTTKSDTTKRRKGDSGNSQTHSNSSAGSFDGRRRDQ